MSIIPQLSFTRELLWFCDLRALEPHLQNIYIYIYIYQWFPCWSNHNDYVNLPFFSNNNGYNYCTFWYIIWCLQGWMKSVKQSFWWTMNYNWRKSVFKNDFMQQNNHRLQTIIVDQSSYIEYKYSANDYRSSISKIYLRVLWNWSDLEFDFINFISQEFSVFFFGKMACFIIDSQKFLCHRMRG